MIEIIVIVLELVTSTLFYGINYMWPSFSVHYGYDTNIIGSLVAISSLLTVLVMLFGKKINKIFGIRYQLLIYLVITIISVIVIICTKNSMFVYPAIAIAGFGFLIYEFEAEYLFVTFIEKLYPVVVSFEGFGNIIAPFFITMLITKNNFDDFFIIILTILIPLSIFILFNRIFGNKYQADKDRVLKLATLSDTNFFQLFKRSDFRYLSLVTFSMGFARKFVITAYLVLFLTKSKMFSASVVGICVAAYGIGKVVGGVVVSSIMNKISKQIASIVSAIFIAIICILIANTNMIMCYVLVFLYGVFDSPQFSLIVLSAKEHFGEGNMQDVLAVCGVLFYLAGAVAPFVGNLVFNVVSINFALYIDCALWLIFGIVTMLKNKYYIKEKSNELV